MKTISCIYTIVVQCLNKAITPEQAIELIKEVLAI